LISLILLKYVDVEEEAVMRRLTQITVILFCAIQALPAQDVQGAPKAAVVDAQTAQRADTTDVRTDLAKMHILLGQMQRNAAFVSPGDTPLKHQFELEIEMWQLLLRDLEKRLNAPQNVPVK
jgi:hypothetical protein